MFSCFEHSSYVVYLLIFRTQVQYRKNRLLYWSLLPLRQPLQREPSQKAPLLPLPRRPPLSHQFHHRSCPRRRHLFQRLPRPRNQPHPLLNQRSPPNQSQTKKSLNVSQSEMRKTQKNTQRVRNRELWNLAVIAHCRQIAPRTMSNLMTKL